jgi:hypothetical protein
MLFIVAPSRLFVSLRGMRANYAFKPIAEQALRSNQTIVPQRLNAALDFIKNLSGWNVG